MRAKKYNPLRKLPETAEEYGEIKIHLSELIPSTSFLSAQKCNVLN